MVIGNQEIATTQKYRGTMEKLNEAQILSNKIIPYLQSLGYPSQFIRPNIRTNQGRVADIVVYREDDAPFIVVEVKRAEQAMPAKDENVLRYDPLVRQVYLYAKELKAPYMLLSNGEDHYWFASDATGRPKLLEEPVSYLAPQETASSTTKLVWLTTVFTRLRELDSYTNQTNIPILLMAKLASEREGSSITTAWPELERNILRSNDVSDSIGRKNESYVVEATRILEPIKLSDYSPTDLLGAIDKLFINYQYRKTRLRVNRWLANFMVQLAQIDESACIMDLACGFGDILAAAKLAEPALEVDATLGISRYEDAALWAMLQEDVLGQSHANVKVSDPLIDSIKPREFSHVIFAPPFGGRVNDYPYKLELFENGVRNPEDLYLEKAIELLKNQNGRVVALVPEGLLFTGGRREYTRQYLMRKMRVTAIIGLPSGALSPYSGIKSSILVLDKKSLTEPYDIFMAQIDSLSKVDTFNAHDLPQVSEVLKAFDDWTRTDSLIFSATVWGKDASALTSENFTTNFYREKVEGGESFLRYETAQLREITKYMGRGRAIKLDNSGNTPVVGPAAIRALAVDENGIQKTTPENIPANPVLIQTGDILLNNIGTYLGQSVVADKELEGMNLSQHVTVIRANSELVDREYLAIVLNSEFVQDQFHSTATGTMMPSLTKASLEATLIPLPPLETQRSIVERVFAAKAKLDIGKQEATRLENDFNQLLSKPFEEGGDQ